HAELGDLLAEHGVFDLALAPGEMTARAIHELTLSAAGHAADARADVGAFVREERLADGPALVDLADDVPHRHADVLEEDLAEGRGAADEVDLARRDAGRLHVDEDEGDALLLLRRRVRADEAEDPIALVRVRRPDLLAVEDEVIAVALRAHLDVGEVGAGAGLGIALAPADLAARDLGEVLPLELFAPVLEARRADHCEAETHAGAREAHRAHLLPEDRGVLAAQARAAVFTRPGGRREAALVADVAPAEDVGIDGRVLLAAPIAVEGPAGRRAPERLGRVLLEERADFFAERLEIAHDAFASALALAMVRATSSIMSSWPPTVFMRPSSTRISREERPYFSAARFAKRRKLE